MKRFALLTLCALAVCAAPAAFGQKKPTGPGPKSKGELEAVNAMLQAQAPDDRIKAAEALTTKYANTDFKSFALLQEAEAYQAKNDNVNAIVFGEQALAADPKNYDAQTLLATVLAASTRENDLDKEEKLTRADKYAHDALEALKTATPSALFAVTPEAFVKIRNTAEAQAWQALGMTALLRKKTDEAVADFQKGVDVNPDPILMIRTGRALLAARKPDEALLWFDKALAAPNGTEQSKSIATSDKARAQSMIKK